MRVFITEKPMVATALAEYIGITGRAEGYFEVKGGDRVTWLYGHLIEHADPDVYIPENLKGPWSFRQLPIIPPENGWRKVPKSETKMQLDIVVGLLKKCEVIVNSGDVDREGQLVSDEVIEYAGLSPEGKHKKILRALIVSLNPTGIARALSRIRSNGEKEFILRRIAATARSETDWLVGMNYTRAVSLQSGRDGVTSMGRVQTPTWSTNTRRHREIENFKPVVYFVPEVMLRDGTKLVWHSRNVNAGAGFDSEGRIIDLSAALAIVERINAGLSGKVMEATSVLKEEEPPLPFKLSDLQLTMGKFGLSPHETMKAAQSLYENHKMVTYVGTDCRHLPKPMHKDAPAVLKGIAAKYPVLAQGADPSLEYRCWNDAHVSAHHAIIPTGEISSGLSHNEKKVFDTVAKRYISQFYPKHTYRVNKLAAEFGDDLFSKLWITTVIPGWRSIYKDSQEQLAVPEDSEGNKERMREGHG
jgi:DNA topoisomerase-3